MQKNDTAEQSIVELFMAVQNRRELATLLNTTDRSLRQLVVMSDEDDRYTTTNIAKRRGGLRRINSPSFPLKGIQRRLASILVLVHMPNDAVHGFVLDRSVVTNAAVHTRKRWVFNADLENFFPSINFGRVRGMFMKSPYRFHESVATLLAQICCHKNELPQGAPTSPIIANMISSRLDRDLARIARRYGCDYTRYADDITFSTQLTAFPRAIGALTEGGIRAHAGPVFEDAVKANGFSINEDKVRLQSPTLRQSVTGLTVNCDVNTTRKYVRQIRAMLHAWEKYGEDAAEADFLKRYDSKDRGGYERETLFSEVVKGKIDYLAMVRGSRDGIVEKFLVKYAQLNPEFEIRPMRLRRRRKITRLQDTLWILECPETWRQGTGFILSGVGLVTCAHVLGPKTYAFQADNHAVRYPVRIVAQNDVVDLAILDLGEKSLPELQASTLKLQRETPISVVGYPNYRVGDTDRLVSGQVAGFRTISTIRRFLVTAPIIAGCSGGPILDRRGFVVGVAVTGADRMEDADQTEDHGGIPISALQLLSEEVSAIPADKDFALHARELTDVISLDFRVQADGDPSL